MDQNLMLKLKLMKKNHQMKEFQQITQLKVFKIIHCLNHKMKYYIYNKIQVISKTENDKKCFGGILMTNKDGLIVCKNTIDVRTEQTFQDSLPVIRSTLFGK